MKISLKHIITRNVLFELDTEPNSIKTTLKAGVKRGAYLEGADLRGADLRGADLRGAYLEGADLEGVKSPPINDHYFVSEILFQNAKTETQKDFAARVRLETNQCWKYFIQFAKKKKVVTWAKEVLGKWEAFQEKFEKMDV